MEWEDIRDGQGRLIGRVSEKNYMGVQQAVSADGLTLGWSKSASALGGLSFTIDNRGQRVSHGEHLELLFRPRAAGDDAVKAFHRRQYGRI